VLPENANNRVTDFSDIGLLYIEIV